MSALAFDDSLTNLDWLQTRPDQVQWSRPAPLHDSLMSLEWLQNSKRSSGPGCPSSKEQLFHHGTDSPSSSAAGESPQFSRYPMVEVDYKTNPKVKPPFSYPYLISKAIQNSKEKKVTLSAIYEWIMENYCYYKNVEVNWQNHIRHTLSFKKCFRKVPREKDEPGQGSFWQMDPEHSDMFINGEETFKRKRQPTDHDSTQKKTKLFRVDKITAIPSDSHSVVPEQEDTLGKVLDDILSGPFNDSGIRETVAALERKLGVVQQPEGNMMNHQLSIGCMEVCVSTIDAETLAEFQMLQQPMKVLVQHEGQFHWEDHNENSVPLLQQSGVGDEQPLEVTVQETLDQGFGGSEGFFTTSSDRSPPTTLTVL